LNDVLSATSALPTHMRHSENAKTMGHDELF
jgi:hypothetical protein